MEEHIDTCKLLLIFPVLILDTGYTRGLLCYLKVCSKKKKKCNQKARYKEFVFNHNYEKNLTLYTQGTFLKNGGMINKQPNTHFQI